MQLVGFPVVAGIVLLAFVSNTNKSAHDRLSNPIRMASLAFSLGLFAYTTAMFFEVFANITSDGLAFNNYKLHDSYEWFPALGIHWTVGLDALSFPMVWLTTFLLPVTIIATWHEKNGATYFPTLLLMGGALIGVFVSLDLFMFYVFWELTLIPMFFLILNWGGKDRKYASQKFFIYTFTASVVMLLGLVTLYLMQPDQIGTGGKYGTMTGRTFDIPTLVEHATAANQNGWFMGESCLLYTSPSPRD